jgi:hypothetical protein
MMGAQPPPAAFEPFENRREKETIWGLAGQALLPAPVSFSNEASTGRSAGAIQETSSSALASLYQGTSALKLFSVQCFSVI